MNKKEKHDFHTLWWELEQSVFPWAEECIGELDDSHRHFMTVCEAVIDTAAFDYAKWKGNGRPVASRLNIFKAFLFKAVQNVRDTKELVRILRAEPVTRRLCGWSTPGLVPSQSTFTRAYEEFAKRGFSEKWFEDLVVKFHGKIEVDTISYDSAPIEVRAKAANMKQKLEEIDPDQPPPPPRLKVQPLRDAKTNMLDLPVECEWGCKRDSHGKKKQWKGGKLHVAVTRDGFPVAVKYTSASLHDSQVMIPLAQQAAARVPHRFDLADAAYDADSIRNVCAELGNVAIIDSNPRKEANKTEMSALEQEFYKDRSAAERYFSHHLDAHGGRTVRVKTPAKIALHLLLGTIVIAVEQLMRMNC